MKITDDMVLFWGGIYSQWYKSAFQIDGITYNCAEQYMMASKAKLFNDLETFKLIMATSDPKKQKALGRQVRGFDETVWKNNCERIVLEASIAKFEQDSYLSEQLLETGDKLMVEASPYDKIWGIGLAEDSPLALDPSKWNGLNLLGQALMGAREHLARKRKLI